MAVKKNQPAVPSNPHQKYIDKAEQLSKQLGVKVDYETVTKKDGEVLVAYFQQPHILAAAKAMDLLYAGKYTEAGMLLWPVCFLREHSNMEIESNQAYKLGFAAKVGLQLDAIAPDVKKN